VETAAVGFRVHSGWAAAVVVCGPVKAPEVVERRKIQLVKLFSYTYRQPYHTAKAMTPPEAANFIRRMQAEGKRLGVAALRSLQADVQGAGWKITRAALLLASGRALPGLKKILASHALIHTADGELFRESLRAACEQCELPVSAMREKELFAAASKELGLPPAQLKQRIAGLGKSLGPPWTEDEKLAALAAWLSLAR